MPQVKSYKNDIFKVITHLDKKDYNYLNTLTIEEIKEIQPLILMKWLSTIQEKNKNKADYYALMTNELVNKNFWELSKYKDLQWKLLCACGCGSWTKHAWVSQKTTKSKTNETKQILKNFFKYLTDEEFEIKYSNLSKKEIDEILENIGFKEDK